MSSDASIIVLSFQIALVATGVTLPVGMFIAWLLARKQFHGKFALDVFVSLPLALPPVVVGYVLLWLVGTHSWFGRLGESVFGSTLAFTWIAAALAAAVVSLPLVVRSFTAALAGVDPRLEVAARGLGSGLRGDSPSFRYCSVSWLSQLITGCLNFPLLFPEIAVRSDDDFV